MTSISRLLLIVAFLASSLTAQTIFVDASATGSGGGGSWANAFTDLTTAINHGSPGDMIWVAEGTYVPGLFRSNSFTFNQISLFGGFPAGGGDGTFQARDPKAFETVLSGDIFGNDTPGFAGRADNCYHVIEIIGSTAGTLDGFTIRGGNANGSSALDDHEGSAIRTLNARLDITNCKIIDNISISDGAVRLQGGIVTLSRCLLVGNQGRFAASFALRLGSHRVENCVISGNVATQNGGGASISGNAHEVVNCTFSANMSPGPIIAVSDSGGSTMLNCIITGSNPGGTMSQTFASFAGPVLIPNHCIIENLETGSVFDNGTNIDVDPMFVDADGADDVVGTGDDDVRLMNGSPAIDAGGATVTLPILDFEGDLRTFGSAADIGADEVPPLAPAGTNEDLVLTTAKNGNTSASGTITATAGDQILYAMTSPNGTFVGEIPLLLGQTYTTGAALVPVFPALNIDISQPGLFVAFDGAAAAPFGAFVLPSTGFNLQATVPVGLGGTTLRLQGLVLSGPTANGIFASTVSPELIIL